MISQTLGRIPTMDHEKILRDHKIRIETQERREKVRKALPALAARVFALSGTSYRGAGFHWNLEKTIGGLLYRVNNFDERYGAEEAMFDELTYEGLVERVEAAEASLPKKAG